MTTLKNLFVWSLFVFLSHGAAAEDIHGNLGYLPVVAETKDKGILVDLLKAMQKSYTDGHLTFDVVPFKRSLEDVVQGRSDFHAPILKDPSKSDKDLGFSYSTANLWDVIFALYTNRNNKKININNLDQFNIETDAGHVGFFNFKVHPSSCLECSLKKVNLGRIDGYIFAAMESDSIVKKEGLKNIKSVAYKTYEGKFVIPNSDKGKRVNAIITQLIEQAKKTGEYEKTIGKITDFYKHWEPMQ